MGSHQGRTLAELSTVSGAKLRGDPQRVVDKVMPLADADETSISFLANPRYKSQLSHTRAAAVVLPPDDADDCAADCLISDNPYLAHAKILTLLHPAREPVPGIHASAVVDESAVIDPTAEIGPGCFVGAGVRIAARTIIGPNCVVLDGVDIGPETQLVASVTLGSQTVLGARCLLHPGVVVGGDGFGLANDEGAWVKVPQVGRAVLGDDVEVGSCSSIDRGALGDTVIADGVKIDSQVHVAHNVHVGKHTAMAGCAAVAGSSTIGEYCTLAGAAGVTGHVELADHVHVSGMTAVTRSIDKPGLYTGTVPAMDHAVWLKNFARLRHLDDMVRRVKKLEKQLAALQEQAEKGS
jgi:UDP-3-O-[3-hydroxymyristoyl] glucosamine N-acyltransferase